MKKKKPKKEIKRELTDKDLKDKELKSSVGDIQKTMASKSEEFNDTIKTIETAGTGVDIVGPENANLTEQVQSTVTKESDGKPTNLKIEGSSGGSEKIQNSAKTGGTSGSTVNSSVSKTGDALNISKSKKTVSTTTITPERKSKNMVMIVGNKNGQSQTQIGMRTKSRTRTIVQKDNSLKDQFALSLF